MNLPTELAELAGRLDRAAVTGTATGRTSEHSKMSVQDAYRVQEALVELRLARGERPTGLKMGFTSLAKMRQMGVDEVIWGRLTDAMQLDDGGELSFGRYVHPRAEPEIAFRLARTPGPGGSRQEVLAAVDAVAPAIEIIDSRYENFRFSLTDVIADNASSAAYVLGSWVPFADVADSVGDLDVALLVDGHSTETGSTAAILDDPLRSLREAVRLTDRYGQPLEAGAVVLAGAATAAVALTPGTRVTATVEGLGTVGFQVSGESA